MKHVIPSSSILSIFCSFILIGFISCSHTTRQTSGPEEPVKDFHPEAKPRKFQNAPPNATVLHLLFTGDSISLVEQTTGSAGLTQYNPEQPDAEVMKGYISVYRYELLAANGSILVSGYFPVDNRVQAFYPGSGNQRDQILHETTTVRDIPITVTVPIDSLNRFAQMRLTKVTYVNGKPVSDVNQGQPDGHATIINLPIKHQ